MMLHRSLLYFSLCWICNNLDVVTSQTRILAPTLSFKCGTSHVKFATRITGLTASVSLKNSWPWMALLGTELVSVDRGGNLKKTKSWFCGGTLINEKWIITAAHCLNDPSTFFVRLGEHDYEDPDDGAVHVDYNVDTFQVHPKYDPGFKYYDIALVKLATVVSFGDAIAPICLPWNIRGPDLDGRDVYVSGWGATQFAGASSPILREVRVKIQNTENCERNYSTISPQFFRREFPLGIKRQHLLCAGDPKTGGDSCQGDSGGPLSMVNTDGSFVIVGVVSGGIGCGKQNLPGLYIPVIEELLWIRRMAFVTYCRSNSDCGDGEICFARNCVDPCERRCGRGAICKIVHGRAACTCPKGYTGNPFSSCTIGISVIGGDPCIPNPCGTNAKCTTRVTSSVRKLAICTCLPTYKGDPYDSCSMKSAGPTEPPVTKSKKVFICQFHAWATYRPNAGKFSVDDIDPTYCTHAMYLYAGLGDDNRIKSRDPNNDLDKNNKAGAYKRFNEIIKSKKKSVMTMLSVGGWVEGSVKYSEMAADARKRGIFVGSVVPFLKRYGFGGLNLIWRHPTDRGGKPEDYENYVKLVKELAKVLHGENMIFSIETPGVVGIIDKGYNIAALSPVVDYILMMTYDLHGHWEHYLHHHSILRAHPTDTGHNARRSVSYVTQHLLHKGADPAKLIVGASAYGRCYAPTDGTKTRIHDLATGPGSPGPYTNSPGMMGFNEICESMMTQNWTQGNDPFMNEPYAYSLNSTPIWCGYESPTSFAVKGTYIKDKNLAGVVFKGIDYDDFTGKCGYGKNPLQKSLYNALNQ